MSTLTMWLVAPLLGLVAAAYASVGLGGGTAYLSLLALWDSHPDSLRPVAWTLNCVVSSIGFVSYYRKGHFEWRRAWAFLVSGLIGGACGSALPLDVALFQILLTVTLGAVGLRMLTGGKAESAAELRRAGWIAPLALGGAVGVVSGIIGIGGGIILGPIVIALGWLDTKRTAAMTSIYIFVSSAGALGAHFARGGTLDVDRIAAFGVFVAIGGWIGARWGAGKAKPKTLRRVFGVVALSVAIKLAVGMLWTA
jgi:uncharacterized membrane protein YfcA